MSDPRPLLLIAASLVCAGLVVAEIAAGDSPGVAQPALPAPRDPGPAARQAPPPPLDTLVAASLARPLFSPTRRPPPQDGPAVDQLTDKRLAGIVILPERRLAIFAVNGTKPLALREGESLNGWRVEAITPHDVLLKGPTGSRTLQPKMEQGPVLAAQAPPGQAVGGMPWFAAPAAVARPAPGGARPPAPTRSGHDQ